MGFMGFLRSSSKKIGQAVGHTAKIIGHHVAPAVHGIANGIHHVAPVAGMLGAMAFGNPSLAVAGKRIGDVAGKVAHHSEKVKHVANAIEKIGHKH